MGHPVLRAGADRFVRGRASLREGPPRVGETEGARGERQPWMEMEDRREKPFSARRNHCENQAPYKANSLWRTRRALDRPRGGSIMRHL
jgi:hypothetical protein